LSAFLMEVRLAHKHEGNIGEAQFLKTGPARAFPWWSPPNCVTRDSHQQ
jgi:hypothetical protein